MWRWCCPVCDVESQVTADQAEAEFWADSHDRTHHGSRSTAAVASKGVSDAA
jgi:hypothetical protein